MSCARSFGERVSSVDSGLYPAYFASRSHFCGRFSYNLHFFCDFLFQLSKDEFENWKSQFAISIPNENMSSQSVTTSDESSRSQFVMLNADAGDLKSQVSSHFPDCQSGHIVHCPGCHPVVLCPLTRHWMPASSILPNSIRLHRAFLLHSCGNLTLQA